MASILVHLTSGPENPTKAALAFLVARTAAEKGHAVSLFLAGDAVQLMREGVLDALTGLGTGALRDHYDAIVSAGGRFYLSVTLPQFTQVLAQNGVDLDALRDFVEIGVLWRDFVRARF